jgi:hypothetical protein
MQVARAAAFAESRRDDPRLTEAAQTNRSLRSAVLPRLQPHHRKTTHHEVFRAHAHKRIEETSEMNKAEIVTELEAMAWHRLFSCPQWLADRETFYAIHQKLIKMGLAECISSDTWQVTPLGRELNLDLFEVFMGLFDEWDALSILENNRLIDDLESDNICARMSRKANPETVLVGYVRRAYFDYGKATKYLH